MPDVSPGMVEVWCAETGSRCKACSSTAERHLVMGWSRVLEGGRDVLVAGRLHTI